MDAQIPQDPAVIQRIKNELWRRGLPFVLRVTLELENEYNRLSNIGWRFERGEIHGTIDINGLRNEIQRLRDWLTIFDSVRARLDSDRNTMHARMTEAMYEQDVQDAIDGGDAYTDSAEDQAQRFRDEFGGSKKRKPKQKRKQVRNRKAAGFFDFIKDPIGAIKEAFSGVPTKLNNISTRTLNEFGNQPIVTLTIARTPLSDLLTNTMNIVSLGKFKELQEKYGYDKLFHLSLLANNQVIIEKNEVVNIEPLNQSGSLNTKTEYLEIPVPFFVDLNAMIETTRIYMGEELFYDYSGLNGNNCQNFILSILKSNNLLTPAGQEFIFQDFGDFTSELNDTHSFIPKLFDKVTAAASIVSRLIAKGAPNKERKNEIAERFGRYLDAKGITHEDLNRIDRHFIDFVERNGLRFL